MKITFLNLLQGSDFLCFLVINIINIIIINIIIINIIIIIIMA